MSGFRGDARTLDRFHPTAADAVALLATATCILLLLGGDRAL